MAGTIERSARCPVGRRPPRAVRGGRQHGLVLAAAGLAMLFAVTVLAALVALTEHEAEEGAQRRLAADAGAAVRVTGAFDPDGAHRADGPVRAALEGVFGGVAHRTEALLRAPRAATDQLSIRATEGSGADALTLLAPRNPARYARLTAGRLPAAGGSGAVETVLRRDFAARLGLRPGSTLVVGEKRSETRLQITGLYEPRDAGAPLWDRMTGTFGASDSIALADPAAVARTPALARDAAATWLAVPDAGRLRLEDIEPLRERTAAFGGSKAKLSVFKGDRPPLADVRVDADLPYALRQLDIPVAVTRAGMYVPVALLAALAAAALLLTARQLTRHREAEQALRAARGGGALQVAGGAAAQWAVVAVPAAVAGPLLAGPLLRGLHDAGLLVAAPPASAATQAGWMVAGAALAVHGVAVLLPAARAVRDRRAVARLRWRAARWAAFQRAGTDLALAAVAVLGWLQLVRYRSPVAGGGTLDPVLLLVPVIMTAAAVLLALRLLPLAGRAADRLGRRSSGFVLPLGGWQLSRRAGGHAGPVLLVALALAVSALGGTAMAILDRGNQDQAAFQVGGDLRVTPGGDGPGFVPRSERYERLAQLPRVQAVSPVVDLDGQVGTESAALAAVNTRSLALADRDLADRVAPLDGRVPTHGLPLPGQPDELTMRVRLSADGPGIPEPFRLGITIEDADGLADTVSRVLPAADGKPHEVRFDLGGRHAPLRITSLQLSTDREEVRRTYRLVIDEVDAAGSGAAWRDLLSEPPHPWTAGCPGEKRPDPAAHEPIEREATGYVLCRTKAKPDTLLDAVLRGPQTAWGDQGLSWQLQMGLSGDREPQPVPALVDDRLADTGQVKPGDTVRFDLDGRHITIRIVGRIDAVPGLEAGQGRLLADSRALSAALVRSGLDPLDDEAVWWLFAKNGDTADALAAVDREPALGAATDIAHRRSELAASPLRTGPKAALLLCLVLAPAFAVIGFTLHTVLAIRRRGREFALLRALGVRGRQLTGLLWTEQLGLALYGAVVGAVVGTALACVITPVVAVDGHGDPAHPELVIQVPWGRMLLLAGGTTLLVCLAVTAAARFLARADLARVLRAGEE